MSKENTAQWKALLKRLSVALRLEKTESVPDPNELYGRILSCCGASVPGSDLQSLNDFPAAKHFIQQIFQTHFPLIDNYQIGFTQSATPVSDDLVDRISSAYAKNCSYSLKNSPLWAHIDGMRQNIHEALLNTDITKLRSIFSDPFPTNFFYGFEVCGESLTKNRQNFSSDRRSYLAAFYFATLLRLAEYRGAIRIDNPEHYHSEIPKRLSVDGVVAAIADNLPFQLAFPNPFPNMPGVKTPRGVFTSRTLQGLYQASVLSSYNPTSVLEIGAGLGWGAYYAVQFGIEDYTIIDIPLSSAASALFLGTTLGEGALSLYDEEQTGKVKILPPDAFPISEKKDVVINVDSMTEMGIDIALDYWNKIKKITKVFISMNHEKNEFTLREIVKNDPDVKSYSRHPNWLRKGYVDEIIELL